MSSNLHIPHSVFGLIGRRLDYSFSRSYFSQKFEQLGLEDHSYKNFEIENAGGLLRFRESVTYNKQNATTDGQSQIVRGLNVTIPYKEAILEILDEIDPVAEAIGAVNTIAIEDNHWKGYNTDAYGFGKSLQEFIPAVRAALILGTGGASKAVAFTLESMGVPYLFVSRKPQNNHTIDYKELGKEHLQQVELIINTTPLGTYPNIEEKPDIPYSYLNEGHYLYDLVYNPAQTLFMKLGLQQGARATNGYQMLVHQAERSWQLWNE